MFFHFLRSNKMLAFFWRNIVSWDDKKLTCQREIFVLIIEIPFSWLKCCKFFIKNILSLAKLNFSRDTPEFEMYSLIYQNCQSNPNFNRIVVPGKIKSWSFDIDPGFVLFLQKKLLRCLNFLLFCIWYWMQLYYDKNIVIRIIIDSG